jgi:NAD(P)-dependent dehydrogenase (short-subunit alcohol dehydrogenase family)
MIILITGCSTGFGLSIAQRFLAAGDTVVATMRDPSRAPAELEGAHVIALDVVSDESVDAAAREILEEHGRIDVLVNNAGVGMHGAIEDTGDSQAKDLFETNFFGTLRVTRAVLPAMRAQGSGVVVNISSLSAVITPPFGGMYAATKWALEAVSEAMHFELAPFGVRVHLIEPGGFDTAFGANRRDVSGTAYTDLMDRWEVAYAKVPGREAGQSDPGRVAEVVFEVANDPSAPLRRLVGDDAELLGALRKQLGDTELERTMRVQLEFWDGARSPVI